MPNEKGSNKPPSNSKQAAASIKNQPMGNGGKGAANKETEQVKGLAQELHWVHRATFWLQVGLGIIGIGALAIYYCQLRQMITATNAAVTASNAAVNTYENTVRPYIEVTIVPTFNIAKPANRSYLTFNAVFKNYGSIPAEAVATHWRIRLGGEDQEMVKADDQPLTLPQGEKIGKFGQIGWEDYPKVMNGTKTLIVYTTYSYNWRQKQQSGCDKFEFLPKAQRFWVLGPICYPN